MVGGDEVLHLMRDHRRTAHAAADEDLRAQHTVARQQLDTDIMQPHRRAVLVGGDHRDLELARQIGEFRVEGRPLPQQLGPGARIGDLIGGGPGELIRRDVADAIARRLDGMHLDGRQFSQDVGRIGQLDPVILDVLARGEMAVAAIIFARDMAEHPHLAAVERAIRHRDAQHIGVQLKIEAVHQPERLELILGQRTRQAALHLVAKFLDTGIDDALVIFVIAIHEWLSQMTQAPASASAGFSVRSGRTVGPSARIRSLIWAGRGPCSVASASSR